MRVRAVLEPDHRGLRIHRNCDGYVRDADRQVWLKAGDEVVITIEKLVAIKGNGGPEAAVSVTTDVCAAYCALRRRHHSPAMPAPNNAIVPGSGTDTLTASSCMNAGS